MNTPNRRIPAAALGGLLRETNPYLSCDECFERIDHHVESVLADPEYRDIPMQVHLAACGVCAEEAETLTELLLGEAPR